MTPAYAKVSATSDKVLLIHQTTYINLEACIIAIPPRDNSTANWLTDQGSD